MYPGGCSSLCPAKAGLGMGANCCAGCSAPKLRYSPLNCSFQFCKACRACRGDHLDGVRDLMAKRVVIEMLQHLLLCLVAAASDDADDHGAAQQAVLSLTKQLLIALRWCRCTPRSWTGLCCNLLDAHEGTQIDTHINQGFLINLLLLQRFLQPDLCMRSSMSEPSNLDCSRR